LHILHDLKAKDKRYELAIEDSLQGRSLKLLALLQNTPDFFFGGGEGHEVRLDKGDSALAGVFFYGRGNASLHFWTGYFTHKNTR
jgi:hypothetical protein